MTFTSDMKAGLLVVRDVPANVCDQCGSKGGEFLFRFKSLLEDV